MLAEFLVEEPDFEPIDSTIERMRKCLHPSTSFYLNNSEKQSRMLETLDDMGKTTIILKSLAHVSYSPSVTALRDLYLQRVLESWPTVVAWMSLAFSKASDIIGVVSRVAGLMEAFLTAAPGTELQEEALTSKGTVDIVFFLLCQKRPDSGRFYVSEPSTQENTRCIIVELVETYFRSAVGWGILTERLGAVKQSTRRTVIGSLVGRALQVAQTNYTTKKDVLYTMEDLLCHLRATAKLVTDTAMWAEFDRQDFIFAYTSAVYQLTFNGHDLKIDDASFWKSAGQALRMVAVTIITDTSTNPLRYFPKATRGGILSACFCALVHLPVEHSEDTRTALVYCQAFLHLSRSEDAAQGHIVEAMQLLEAIQPNEDSMHVCTLISRTLYQNVLVYRERKEKDISICSNLQV